MSICFIGGGILDAIKGIHAGGAEKQVALIIKGLQSRGAEIIVLEYNLIKPKEFEGISFYPAWDRKDHSFLSKFKKLINNINKHKIDSIYTRGTQLYVAVLFFYLKLSRSKIELYWGLAHDHNLTSKYNKTRVGLASSFYERINLGILHNFFSIILFYFSDKVICQTLEQVQVCKSKYGDKSIEFISNIYDNELHNEIKFNGESIADAIWIGRLAGVKGEEYLLKMAKEIPEMKIVCLGNVSDAFKNTSLYSEIKRQSNIVLVGNVPYKEVANYISKVDFIINTSPSEGLSNVFLEGWSQEKPILSLTVNPNQSLTLGEGGYCAQGSYPSFITKNREILKDKKFMEYYGRKGKEILIKNHYPEIVLPKYYELFFD